MSRLFPKIATITLLGIVFLLGGAGTARAAGTCSFPSLTDKVSCETANGVWTETASSGTAITSTQGTGTATDVYMFGTNGTRFNSLSACQAAMGSNGPCVKTGTAYLQKTDTTPAELKGFSCGIFGTSSLTDCLPIGTYYLIYKPASYLLEGSGYIMDKMLSLSIEGDLVVPPFIDTSWTVVRDFSNMLFIFILLYTGIMTMFGAKDWRQTILWVIVIALLINFSLFFTKVVIDAGNILAVGVKSSITVPGKSISESLVGAFQPQAFLSTAGKAPSAMDAIIVFIVATIVSVFTAYVLFKVTILFSRRLIVFWALMILSPFAFISIALPKKMNKFDEWLDALISLSFVAPIFLFFIYLIIQVINAPGLTPDSKMLDVIKIPSGTWFTKLLGPVLVAALLVKALQEALRFTEDFAGTTGEAFSGLVSGAMGMAGGAAVGAATGGASLLARQTVGRYAASKLAGGELKEGSWQHSLATGASKASFDVRNVGKVAGVDVGKYVGKGFGAFGVDTKKGMGAMGVKEGKGGYAAHATRREDTDMAGAEKAELTDGEKKAINSKYGVEDKEAEAKKQGQHVVERAEIVATAEKNKKDAETAAQNSTAGQALAGAQTQLKTQTDAAQKATVEVATAQKALETAIDRVGAQKTLDEAVMKESQALGAVKSAQAVVDSTTATYSTETQKDQQAIKDADQALSSAKKDLADAQKNAQASVAEARSARDTATKEIVNENDKRRVKYAENTHDVFSSPEARKARVDKIRKGRTPEEKAKAKERAEKEGKEASEKTEQAKLLKALAKQLKENDGGGKEKKEDKEKEGGSH